MNKAEEKTKEELLIHERSNGKSLRQLGQMFGMSHEWVRQLLSEYDRSQVTLLPERRVAINLGYPVGWLVQLRKEGIIKPIKLGFWLYSQEQVRQIPSLIAGRRKCEQCDKPRPSWSHRFCIECSQYRKRQRALAWRKTQRRQGAIRLSGSGG
ncbi:hypothetical protein ACFLWO_03385 [Chloroflexota bacterium]